MRAMLLNKPGDYNSFIAAEVPDPVPQAGQVRIKVCASSVNPLDLKIRSGSVAVGPDWPAILHSDVGGWIDQVGSGVTHFKPGDAVIGCAGGLKGHQGALADLMLADARLLTHAPSTLSLEEASVLPLVFVTAWSALIERCNLQAGMQVLIHGGTGGVGQAAIQLAKARGAKVFTTVSSATKAKIAQNLGADVAINYTQETPAEYVARLTQGAGFPIVFDTVGGQCLDNSFLAAKVGGQVVSINTRSQHDLTLMHSKGLTLHVVFRALPLLTGLDIEAERARLAAMVELIDTGHLRPLIAEKTFGFHEVGAAHAYLDSGQALGKILLRHQGI